MLLLAHVSNCVRLGTNEGGPQVSRLRIENRFYLSIGDPKGCLPTTLALVPCYWDRDFVLVEVVEVLLAEGGQLVFATLLPGNVAVLPTDGDKLTLEILAIANLPLKSRRNRAAQAQPKLARDCEPNAELQLDIPHVHRVAVIPRLLVRLEERLQARLHRLRHLRPRHLCNVWM